MKYRVSGTVTGGVYIGDFEADSPAGAAEKAEEAADVSLCHYCADKIVDPEITEYHVEPLDDDDPGLPQSYKPKLAEPSRPLREEAPL